MCKYNADHGTSVDASVVSGMFEYNHEQWEAQYAKSVISHAETELQPGLSSQKDAIPEFCHPRRYLASDLLHDVARNLTLDLNDHSTPKPEPVHCDDLGNCVLEESLIIGPISSDTDVMEDESLSVLHDAVADDAGNISLDLNGHSTTKPKPVNCDNLGNSVLEEIEPISSDMEIMEDVSVSST